MATDLTVRRYRGWYARLLRLYPKPFHERFGEGMEQTFHDLCRERRGAKRGLFAFALWIVFETLIGIIRENTTHMTQLSKTILRSALVAPGLLMVPLVASRVVDGWTWAPGSFVFARWGLAGAPGGAGIGSGVVRDGGSVGRVVGDSVVGCAVGAREASGHRSRDLRGILRRVWFAFSACKFGRIEISPDADYCWMRVPRVYSQIHFTA